MFQTSNAGPKNIFKRRLSVCFLRDGIACPASINVTDNRSHLPADWSVQSPEKTLPLAYDYVRVEGEKANLTSDDKAVHGDSVVYSWNISDKKYGYVIACSYVDKEWGTGTDLVRAVPDGAQKCQITSPANRTVYTHYTAKISC